jgi:hypothetical protein
VLICPPLAGSKIIGLYFSLILSNILDLLMRIC